MSQEDDARERNDQVSHRLEFGEYGFIQFQKGPRPEVGLNGLLLAEDVLPRLLDHLKALNLVLPCRENSLAVTKLEECIMWLEKRHANRVKQGVFDTFKPHS